MNLFVSNLVLTYIVVIILDAFDFYVVKNITGRYAFQILKSFRILVGLRWSSYVDEQGKEQWAFDSLDNSKPPTLLSSNFFPVRKP